MTQTQQDPLVHPGGVGNLGVGQRDMLYGRAPPNWILLQTLHGVSGGDQYLFIFIYNVLMTWARSLPTVDLGPNNASSNSRWLTGRVIQCLCSLRF